MDLAFKAHSFLSLFLISLGLLMLLAIRRPALRGLAAALTLIPMLRGLGPLPVAAPAAAPVTDFLVLALVGAGLISVFSLHREEGQRRRMRVFSATIGGEEAARVEAPAEMVRT